MITARFSLLSIIPLQLLPLMFLLFSSAFPTYDCHGVSAAPSTNTANNNSSSSSATQTADVPAFGPEADARGVITFIALLFSICAGPTLLLDTQMALSNFQFSRCANQSRETAITHLELAMPFPENLLPFVSIGDAQNGYFRGTLVSNVVIIPIIAVGVTVAAGFYLHNKKVEEDKKVEAKRIKRKKQAAKALRKQAEGSEDEDEGPKKLQQSLAKAISVASANDGEDPLDAAAAETRARKEEAGRKAAARADAIAKAEALEQEIEQEEAAVKGRDKKKDSSGGGGDDKAKPLLEENGEKDKKMKSAMLRGKMKAAAMAASGPAGQSPPAGAAASLTKSTAAKPNSFKHIFEDWMYHGGTGTILVVLFALGSDGAMSAIGGIAGSPLESTDFGGDGALIILFFVAWCFINLTTAKFIIGKTPERFVSQESTVMQIPTLGKPICKPREGLVEELGSSKMRFLCMGTHVWRPTALNMTRQLTTVPLLFKFFHGPRIEDRRVQLANLMGVDLNKLKEEMEKKGTLPGQNHKQKLAAAAALASTKNEKKEKEEDEKKETSAEAGADDAEAETSKKQKQDHAEEDTAAADQKKEGNDEENKTAEQKQQQQQQQQPVESSMLQVRYRSWIWAGWFFWHLCFMCALGFVRGFARVSSSSGQCQGQAGAAAAVHVVFIILLAAVRPYTVQMRNVGGCVTSGWSCLTAIVAAAGGSGHAVAGLTIFTAVLPLLFFCVTSLPRCVLQTLYLIAPMPNSMLATIKKLNETQEKLEILNDPASNDKKKKKKDKKKRQEEDGEDEKQQQNEDGGDDEDEDEEKPPDDAPPNQQQLDEDGVAIPIHAAADEAVSGKYGATEEDPDSVAAMLSLAIAPPTPQEAYLAMADEYEQSRQKRRRDRSVSMVGGGGEEDRELKLEIDEDGNAIERQKQSDNGDAAKADSDLDDVADVDSAGAVKKLPSADRAAADSDLDDVEMNSDDSDFAGIPMTTDEQYKLMGFSDEQIHALSTPEGREAAVLKAKQHNWGPASPGEFDRPKKSVSFVQDPRRPSAAAAAVAHPDSDLDDEDDLPEGMEPLTEEEMHRFLGVGKFSPYQQQSGPEWIRPKQAHQQQQQQQQQQLPAASPPPPKSPYKTFSSLDGLTPAARRAVEQFNQRQQNRFNTGSAIVLTDSDDDNNDPGNYFYDPRNLQRQRAAPDQQQQQQQPPRILAPAEQLAAIRREEEQRHVLDDIINDAISTPRNRSAARNILLMPGPAPRNNMQRQNQQQQQQQQQHMQGIGGPVSPNNVLSPRRVGGPPSAAAAYGSASSPRRGGGGGAATPRQQQRGGFIHPSVAPLFHVHSAFGEEQLDPNDTTTMERMMRDAML